MLTRLDEVLLGFYSEDPEEQKELLGEEIMYLRNSVERLKKLNSWLWEREIARRGR